MSRAHYIRYLRLYYYHWVDISAHELLVPTWYIIHPVVSVLHWHDLLDILVIKNLKFLNNVINITKMKT